MKSGEGKAGYISKFIKKLGYKEINDIAASFQDAITEILTEKAIAACKKTNVRRLVLGGGVSANTQLRKKISNRAAENRIRLFIPSKKLCLDNAAMVAGLGGALYKRGKRSDFFIGAHSTSEPH